MALLLHIVLCLTLTHPSALDFWVVARCLSFLRSSSDSCSRSARSGGLRDSWTWERETEASQRWWEAISERSMQRKYQHPWNGIFREGITSEWLNHRLHRFSRIAPHSHLTVLILSLQNQKKFASSLFVLRLKKYYKKKTLINAKGNLFCQAASRFHLRFYSSLKSADM